MTGGGRAEHLCTTAVMRLTAIEEIVLETTRLHGERRRTPIWIVVVEDEVYVRSWHGAAGAWYRDLRRQPTAVIDTEGTHLRVTAVHVDDSATLEQVSAAYLAKYNFSTYARRYAQELQAKHAIAATLRLVPADQANTARS